MTNPLFVVYRLVEEGDYDERESWVDFVMTTHNGIKASEAVDFAAKIGVTLHIETVEIE